jgi:acyl carrier protein
MDTELMSYIERRERALGRVRRILIDDLHVARDPDEIDPDAPLFGTGLGLDSVDAVELVVGLETLLGKRLPEGELGRGTMRTVNMLVDIVLAVEEGAHAAR